MRRENGIGIATELARRQRPAFLPEIKPAKQQQAIQSSRRGGRPAWHWILEVEHSWVFIGASSCPVRLVVIFGLSARFSDAILRLVQSQPLGLLELNHARILHHDFHDAIAQGLYLLGDQLQPP